MTAQKTFNKYLMGTISAMALLCMSAPAFASEADILKKLEALQATITAQSQELSQLRTDNEKLHQEVAATKEKADKTAVKADKAAAMDLDASSFAAINPAAGDGGKVSGGILDAIDGAMLDHEKNAHASKLKVGGWVGLLYLDSNKRNFGKIMEPMQMYVYLDAKLDNNWRTYGEIEFEHTPNAGEGGNFSGTPPVAGVIKVERLYAEYNHNALLNARFGKFSTPAGIWMPEHWNVSVPSIQKPINEDNQYIPNKQVGVEAFGTHYPANKSIPTTSYHLWTSTGEQVFGTEAANNNNFGIGADVDTTFAEVLKVGLSAYNQDNGLMANRNEKTFQPYVEMYLPYGVTLTGEYLHQAIQAAADVDEYYAAAKWQFHPQAYAYYRRDRGNDVARGGAINNGHTGNVFTLGYWPKPYARMKFEYSTHTFDDPAMQNFQKWGAFLGVIF